MAINALESNSSTATGGQVIDLQLAIENARKKILTPAGPANESIYVYEDIAGKRIKAWAVTGSESLTTLLSAAGAENHWLWESHGELISWREEYSHLLREGMFVFINSSAGGSFKLFRVKAGTTAAQRLVNPSDPAQVAYETWSVV